MTVSSDTARHSLSHPSLISHFWKKRCHFAMPLFYSTVCCFLHTWYTDTITFCFTVLNLFGLSVVQLQRRECVFWCFEMVMCLCLRSPGGQHDRVGWNLPFPCGVPRVPTRATQALCHLPARRGPSHLWCQGTSTQDVTCPHLQCCNCPALFWTSEQLCVSEPWP